MFFLNKVGIIGAGSYGTALAQCFSRKAKEILLVSDVEVITSNINELHMNLTALCGISLAMNISCTNDFSEAKDGDIIFIAVPMAAVPLVFREIKKQGIAAPVVLCSKGFDVENGRLQSDLFEEILDNDYAILSGPSFADEIAQGLPAEVNIASKNNELSREIAESLSSEMFKMKAMDDYIGLQVAGAVKNILAIGCGILSELSLGSGAVAKLIVNGLNEMAELAVSLGGKRETFLGLGGVGDTVLTCTSGKSRNVLFGKHLAAGGSVDDWNGPLVEGVSAVEIVPIFQKKYNVELKILSEIFQVIHRKKNIFEAISRII